MKNRYIATINDMALNQIMNSKKNMCILDFGCGTGELINALAPANNVLIGIDISIEALNIAQSKANNYNSNCFFSLFNGIDIPFGNNVFDIIITRGVLVYFTTDDSLEHALGEFYRILKPGGCVILTEHSTYRKRFDMITNKIYRPISEYGKYLTLAGFRKLEIRIIRKARFLPSWLGFRRGLLPGKLIKIVAIWELKIRQILPMSRWDYYDVLYYFQKDKL